MYEDCVPDIQNLYIHTYTHARIRNTHARIHAYTHVTYTCSPSLEKTLILPIIFPIYHHYRTYVMSHVSDMA